MKEKRNRAGLVIGILILVIIALLVVIAYAFVVNPAITAHVIKSQTQGYEYAIVQIAQTAGYPSCQQVPLRIGNQTVNLIAVECLQQSLQ